MYGLWFAWWKCCTALSPQTTCTIYVEPLYKSSQREGNDSTINWSLWFKEVAICLLNHNHQGMKEKMLTFGKGSKGLSFCHVFSSVCKNLWYFCVSVELWVSLNSSKQYKPNVDCNAALLIFDGNIILLFFGRGTRTLKQLALKLCLICSFPIWCVTLTY